MYLPSLSWHGFFTVPCLSCKWGDRKVESSNNWLRIRCDVAGIEWYDMCLFYMFRPFLCRTLTESCLIQQNERYVPHWYIWETRRWWVCAYLTVKRTFLCFISLAWTGRSMKVSVSFSVGQKVKCQGERHPLCNSPHPFTNINVPFTC